MISGAALTSAMRMGNFFILGDCRTNQEALRPIPIFCYFLRYKNLNQRKEVANFMSEGIFRRSTVLKNCPHVDCSKSCGRRPYEAGYGRDLYRWTETRGEGRVWKCCPHTRAEKICEGRISESLQARGGYRSFPIELDNMRATETSWLLDQMTMIFCLFQ